MKDIMHIKNWEFNNYSMEELKNDNKKIYWAYVSK